MIFWIVLAIAIICTVVFIAKGHDCYYDAGWFGGTVISWALVAIMLIFIIVANLGAPSDIVANQQIYNSLTYQVENNLYDNDNEVGKAELVKQVTEWNTGLARGKYDQNNIWYGIFIPDIYDNFEFIPIENIK